MFFLLDAANTVTTATTATNSFLNPELVAALICSCFTLLGVFIGNTSSRKTAKSQEEIKLLSEFYSEVFAAFTDSAPFVSPDKQLSFVIAAEKAKLLCSEESEKILDSLIQEILDDKPDPDTCVKLIIELRKSAKEDLRKR